MRLFPPTGFWREAIAIQGSTFRFVLPQVALIGVIATAIVSLESLTESLFNIQLGLELAPHEIAGALLGLLLLMRTNAGYDRWWEARKLWGGIVNQSRNLAINGLAYGPKDPEWQNGFVRWVASFPHIARCSLRGEGPPPEVVALLGAEEAAKIGTSAHMTSYVAFRLAGYLRRAAEANELDRFAFLRVDQERAQLIDHVGACERILKTPMPLVLAIKIRRFIALFLLTLPFSLLHHLTAEWLIPLLTMIVAYPLFSLDRIGVELQNPFAKENLSHLPLGDISANIEKNVMGLLAGEKI